MHPIEHLRYVARARGADATSLVREAGVALGSLRADHANLVIACRRIVQRHPEAGPLWWLSARILTSDDPDAAAWELVDEIEADATPRTLARALPDGATVLTIGYPDVAGDALARRGDVRVLCADSRHEASSFMQRLERCDVECEPIPAESLARAAAVADAVVVEALAACPTRVLGPVGSHVLAAVARSVGTPVWLVAGIGRRLPPEYVAAIADEVVGDLDHGDDDDDADDGRGALAWDVDVDEIPTELVTRVVSNDGVSDDVAAALRPDAPFAPELLRFSPF